MVRRRWAAVLLAVVFTDELATGVIPSGAPELLDAFDLSPARAAGWTLFAFGILGFVLEPPLLALARGRRARPLRVAGLAVMAVTMFAAAAAPSYWLLLLALVFYGPASGLGVNLAQAALIAANPGRHAQVLARWTLLGYLGDLVAPAAIALSVALGAGWRGAVLAAAGIAGLQAFAAYRMDPAASGNGEEDEDGGGVAEAIRLLIRHPRVAAWTLVAIVCGLMDEILISFGALSLEARLGADATQRAVILGAWLLAGILGSILLERHAHRLRPSTWMVVSGLGCAVGYGAWLFAPTWQLSAASLAVAGFFVAGHYPLLKARAYAALPGQPHVVVAAGSLIGNLDLALPLLVGVVADRLGTFAAVAVLIVQPLVVLLSGLVTARSRDEGAALADEED